MKIGRSVMQLGEKFNRLEFIEDLGMIEYGTKGSKHRIGLFKCDCGNTTVSNCCDVRRGSVKSCGCYNIELIISRNTIHGLRHHPLHVVWSNMKLRCYSKKSKSYSNYGGRGILLCNEWKNSFINFYDWAMNSGWKEGLQIDRVDNDGNYEPNNCRWVTLPENCGVGRRRLRKDNSSGFTGIYSKNGKWVAELSGRHLGTFISMTEAIEFRIAKEIEKFGKQRSNLHYVDKSLPSCD